MSSNANLISSVPTNIITGFLGAGKTSAILNLLRNKPSNERWAVLVNEFGEIGIDGSLFKGLHTEEEGVYIREVPGGCMCCTAGLPMRTALNQLLKHSKPDRLLIEPTGLGHPTEVLETLTGPHFKKALTLQKIITLVDARNLSDSRYTEHETFNQQIAIADTIIGNKQDLYQPGDEASLQIYAGDRCKPHVQILFTRQGEINPELLEGPTHRQKATTEKHNNNHHHSHASAAEHATEELPENGFIKAANKGEGLNSIGWRFPASTVFSHNNLSKLFASLEAERMKAVLNTDKGIYGYNLSSGNLTKTLLQNKTESRVEIIALNIDSDWEERLLNCRL